MGTYSNYTGGLFNRRQDLAGHFGHMNIRIGVRQKGHQRVLALHTIDRSGVNSDQISSTQFCTFGSQTDAGTEHQ